MGGNNGIKSFLENNFINYVFNRCDTSWILFITGFTPKKLFKHDVLSCHLYKGPIISEDICGIFQLPKKYSVFLSLACWSLSFEFSRTFLESVSKSWGFQLSPRGLNSDFQWIWQMICLICWWNYQKCTHFVVIHNNTFSNFKFWIVQDRNLEYFLGYMKNDLHFLKESHLYYEKKACSILTQVVKNASVTWQSFWPHWN